MRPRVLVARLDSLGDVLLAGPAVRAVAAHADVVMLCGPRGEAGARMLPGVSEVLVWDAPWISDPAPDASAARIAEVISMLGRARISEAVILTSFHQSPLPLALLLRTTGVARITAISEDYPGSLLDLRLRPGIDVDEDIPEPERALAVAAAAGFEPPADRRLRVNEPPPTEQLTGRGSYVVLHPGAAVPARRWPVEHFARAAAMLTERGRRVVLTGGPDETGLTAAVRREAPDAVDLAGACSLPQLAGVLARADAVVCGNTGPAHLAAAVGTPVVSLFSPVVPPERWAPYGVPLRLLGDQHAPCRGTRARLCPVPSHPCLAGVSPEEVVRAVLELEAEAGAEAAAAGERLQRTGAAR